VPDLNTGSWGSISAKWNEALDVLTITFGGGTHSVSVGSTITIGEGTIGGRLTGATASGSPVTIQGSNAKKAPRLLSAVATDTSGERPGIQDGDTVTLTFDQAMFGYTPIPLDYELVVPGKTWGTCDQAWTTTVHVYDTLTITFRSGTPTIAVGDPIIITGVYVLRDNGEPAIASPPLVTGSFTSNTTPPEITITAPVEGLQPEDAIAALTVVVAGTVEDDVAVANVTVNGLAAGIDNGSFEASVPLLYDGENIRIFRLECGLMTREVTPELIEEVFLISEPVSYALDHFDFVIDAF